jgi:hypothetical protein
LPRPSPSSITQNELRLLVAATFTDHLSRLQALEAQEAARRARRDLIQGRLTEDGLAAQLSKLAKARRAAAEAARWRNICELKYSPDQPRDDHGRWTSGGGEAGSPAAAKPSSLQRGELSMKHEVSYRPGQDAAAAGAVSTGKGDAGGVSYGAFQLSSQKGQVQAFLKSLASAHVV